MPVIAGVELAFGEPYRAPDAVTKFEDSEPALLPYEEPEDCVANRIEKRKRKRPRILGTTDKLKALIADIVFKNGPMTMKELRTRLSRMGINYGVDHVENTVRKMLQADDLSRTPITQDGYRVFVYEVTVRSP